MILIIPRRYVIPKRVSSLLFPVSSVGALSKYQQNILYLLANYTRPSAAPPALHPAAVAAAAVAAAALAQAWVRA
jgi:hypothetical protein